MRLGGVPQRARHVSIARAPKLRRYPGEGSAVTPGRVDAVSEFGRNLVRFSPPEIDRRSRRRGRGRSTECESRPTSPIFAHLVRIRGSRPNLGDLETAELDSTYS